MLLRAENRAWASDPNPPDKECCRELVVLHGVAPDERACSSQSSFAVDGQDARVPLTHLQEFVHDEIRRGRAVNEEHISMIDSILREFSSVVLSLIQADNVRDSEVAEDLQIIFWLVTSSVGPDLVNGTHECDELARKNPVEITILDFLVVLVLFVVELPKVIPAMANGDLEPFETVEDRAAVGAVAVAGISERSEASLVGRKSFPRNLSRLSQDHNHEGAHEVRSIRLLVEHV